MCWYLSLSMRVYLEFWPKRKTLVFIMKLLLSYVFLTMYFVEVMNEKWKVLYLLLEIWCAVVQRCSKLDLGIFKVGFFQLPLTRWTCIASIVHLTFNTLPMCCPSTSPPHLTFHKRTVCWHLMLVSCEHFSERNCCLLDWETLLI